MALAHTMAISALFKADSARRIDRVIDYFGGAGMEWMPLASETPRGSGRRAPATPPVLALRPGKSRGLRKVRVTARSG